MSDETGRGRGATTTIEEIREILADTAREGRRIQQEAEKRQAEHEAAAKKRQADFEKWRAENEAAAKEQQAKDEKRHAENEAAAKEQRAKDEKRHAENEAAAKKRQADLEKWCAKTEAATEKWRVECEKRVRRLDSLFSSQWGALVESLVAGDLVKLLRKRGIKITGLRPNPEQAFNGRPYEIDIVAINGEDVVVVEVKTTLRVDDVNKFLEFLPLFGRIFSEYARKRIRGAVAYIKSHEESHVYAQRKGLFVIRATGSSASIINPKKFKAKKF